MCDPKDKLEIFCIIVGKNETIEVYNNLHKGREISIFVFDRSLTEQSICRAQKKKHVNRSEPLDSRVEYDFHTRT